VSKEDVDLVRLACAPLEGGWDDRVVQGGVDQGVMAPDVELIPAREFPDAEPAYRGPEAINEFMRAWTEGFSGHRLGRERRAHHRLRLFADPAQARATAGLSE
jgi:hypothetical protein